MVNRAADAEQTLRRNANRADLATGQIATTRERVRHAWYASIGTLARYRGAEAMLDADETGDGTMVVIVRDHAGGVAWQAVPVQIR